MRKIYIACIVFIAFAFIGGFATGVIINKNKNIQVDKITVNTISGEPAVIQKATAGKDSIAITENHDGAGSSEIVIPYSEIPPAYNWMNKTIGIELLFSPRKNIYAIGSYRYESIIFSAGICVPFLRLNNFNRYDIFAGAGLWL